MKEDAEGAEKQSEELKACYTKLSLITVIASGAKQSRVEKKELDCLVASLPSQ